MFPKLEMKVQFLLPLFVKNNKMLNHKIKFWICLFSFYMLVMAALVPVKGADYFSDKLPRSGSKVWVGSVIVGPGLKPGSVPRTIGEERLYVLITENPNLFEKNLVSLIWHVLKNLFTLENETTSSNRPVVPFYKQKFMRTRNGRLVGFLVARPLGSKDSDFPNPKGPYEMVNSATIKNITTGETYPVCVSEGWKRDKLQLPMYMWERVDKVTVFLT
jgi:hypothetical protein